MKKSKSFLDHILSIVPTNSNNNNKVKSCSNIKIKNTCGNKSINENEKLEQAKIEGTISKS
jgi:hypothetical protein